MKTWIMILMFITIVVAWLKPVKMVPESQYLKLVDSVQQLHYQTVDCEKQLALVRDSCVILRNKPLMSVDQFKQLYNYNRLEKYYKICKKNPSQWKYYKGWSTRVFEQEDEQ